MRKIISTMAIACLSFSCFAESYFVKIAKDEYVLQHGEKSKDPKIEKLKSLGYLSSAPVDAVYTPTHIFTYPDGTPSLFRNIQKIEYTESKVTFYKDIKTRKCCIDIYDDEKNSNKCQIIGVNGHNIGSFEVYEASGEANSFTDSKQRLIYVDHSGLYIVEEDKNAVEDISKNYIPNGKFDFNVEIIKISAIDGKWEVSGFNENKKAIFAFNCPSDTPISFGIEATPFMKQIEEITGVKLVTPPPSEKAALKRMAEILDVPVRLLVFEDGEVKLVEEVAFQSTQSIHFGTPPSSANNMGAILGSLRTTKRNVNQLPNSLNVSGGQKDHPFAKQLKGIIPVADNTVVSINETIEKASNYEFDTSPEAQQRRKEIAQKPWDE